MLGEITRDSIARGRLIISQPRRGYRFSVDSVILAGFASPPARRICDLGTGSGIVGLWLAKEGAEYVVGLELQPELAEMARRNAFDNGLSDRFEVREADFSAFSLSPGETPFDQVVSNPPFAPLGGGRIDANRQRAVARHEVAMRLADLFSVAKRLLAPGGRLDVIHRADREAELIDACRENALTIARLRRVLPRAGDRPSRILLEARAVDDGGLGEAPLIEPDLVIHLPDGRYGPEMAALLGEESVE